MSISQKDIKILWGRAANRCSICKCDLAPSNNHGANFLIGEQAHIVGELSTGPRGNSILSDNERNCYDNLILLCPTHHTEIDKDEKNYPVEKLHSIKSTHELWVKTQLSNVYDNRIEANELIYADLVDAIVERCELYRWDYWSSYANSSQNIIWESSIADNAFELTRKIGRAVFPKTLNELERSIETVSLAFNAVVNILYDHCDTDNEMVKEDRFYKIDTWDKELYYKLLEKYKTWKKIYYEMFEQLCMSLNWFADNVRRDINPLFFAIEGKFITTQFNGLSTNIELHEFTENERSQQPNMITKKIAELQETYSCDL